MERLAVAVVLLGTSAAVSGWARLPVAAVGCGVVLLAYRERFAPVLGRFLLIWMIFSAAVGAGRYWAGVPLSTLAEDTSASVGLALGVAGAVLLLITGRPSDLLGGLDRLRAPREFSYALLALIGLLPRIAAVGSRQMALLKLKGAGGGGIAQRFRAYPRIVAPLFGVLLNQQLAHARSMALRGFFADPRSGSAASPVVERRGWIVIGLLVLHAAVWFAVATWIG